MKMALSKQLELCVFKNFHLAGILHLLVAANDNFC